MSALFTLFFSAAIVLLFFLVQSLDLTSIYLKFLLDKIFRNGLNLKWNFLRTVVAIGLKKLKYRRSEKSFSNVKGLCAIRLIRNFLGLFLYYS